MSSIVSLPQALFPDQAAWKALLRRHSIRPDKKLGQNFLFDRNSLLKVVSAAEFTGTEVTLEIGAGVGALTIVLANFSKRVVAIELDRRLWPALLETTDADGRIQLIHGDILETPLEGLVDIEPYVVVANIPYNITSAVIRKLLVSGHRPARIVLTIQREVAERIVAPPGEMSLLSLSVQAYGLPAICGEIPPKCFFPAPRVASAILRIDPHTIAVAPPDELEKMLDIARAGFSQRRKQLTNSLSGGLGRTKDEVLACLREARIDPSRRAQSLSLREWIELARLWAEVDEQEER
jgi:16S rRNA (adenine1518-N6/adenine1519-N6)-dimethyltransferase